MVVIVVILLFLLLLLLLLHALTLDFDNCLPVFKNNFRQWRDGFPLGFQVWQVPYHLNLIPSETSWREKDHSATIPFDQYIHDNFDTPHPLVFNNSCTAAVVYTSTELNWITIPCSKSFAGVLLLCERRLKKESNSSNTTSLNAVTMSLPRQVTECPYGWVLVETKCYRMLNLGSIREIACEALDTICLDIGGTSAKFDTSQLIVYLKHWINKPLEESIYIVQHNADKIRCINKKFINTETPTMNIREIGETSGMLQTTYALCERVSDVIASHCLHNQYSCLDGTCIAAHHHCDGNVDCADSSDEISCDTVCVFQPQSMLGEATKLSCFVSCFPWNCQCSDLYFQCKNSGKCVPSSKLCDHISDCAQHEDELFCMDMENNDFDSSKIAQWNGVEASFNFIKEEQRNSGGILLRQQTKCRFNLSRCAKDGYMNEVHCFPRYKVCLFELDNMTKSLKYCPNGEHLHHCINHVCPSAFKCPDSYCVPYHYVCNNRFDCPHGEDEQNCPLLSCTGMLFCRHDKICVHPNYVGDGEDDCPLSHDDELLNNVGMCPVAEQCNCLGRAFSCPFSNWTDLPETVAAYRSVLLVGNKIQRLARPTPSHFPVLIILDLSQNIVRSLLDLKLKRFSNLIDLRIADNLILSLENEVFLGVESLKFLDLHNNTIHSIQGNAFRGIRKLQRLDVSDNPIQSIIHKIFDPCKHSLMHLRLLNVSLSKPFLRAINDLPKLMSVSVHFASYCPYIIKKDVKCVSTVKNYVVCCRLINSKSLRVFLWGFVGLSLILNTACILMIAIKGRNIVIRTISLFLHTNDMMLTLYLVCIATIDHHLHDMYLLHHTTLLSGAFCNTLAALLSTADALSLLGVLFGCFQRAYVIVRPFGDAKYPLKWYALSTLCFLIAHSLVVFIPYHFYTMHLLSTPCSLMPAVVNGGNGTPYLSSFYLTLHCVLRFSVVLMNSIAIRGLQKSTGEKLGQSGGNAIKIRAIQRNSLILADNVFGLAIECGIQSVLMYVEVHSTVMVALSMVLYIRCLSHPLLYTLSTALFREWLSSICRN